MSPRTSGLGAILVMALFPVASAFAQAGPKSSGDQPMALKASELAFSDVSVPGFAPGMQIAVLHGDPSQAGPYTLRLKFPDGYAFPPHWHPNVEHVTVVSGNFYLGMGDKVNKDVVSGYVPGDYLYAPPHKPHFGWVKGETVIQLHGVGPFEIKLAGEQ